jgi:hypothetical protein
MKDVQLTAANDDQYFIFEDMIYQAMLCFSRDTEVRPHCKQKVIFFPVSSRDVTDQTLPGQEFLIS